MSHRENRPPDEVRYSLDIKKPPYFPDSEEIWEFTESNIWPAATYLWGENCLDPDKITEVDPIIKEEECEDEEGNLRKVSVSIYTDSEFEFDDDGTLDESRPHDSFVTVELESYRYDLTETFQKHNTAELEVWESICYEFPIDGSLPTAERYYILKDDEGETIYEPSIKHARFLKRVNSKPQYSIRGDVNLDSQDIVDIHNVLLVLGVPEDTIISPISSAQETWS